MNKCDMAGCVDMAQLTAPELETLGGCASCKTMQSRLESQALWVDFEDTGYLIEICKYCAEDYYPEAVKINER